MTIDAPSLPVAVMRPLNLAMFGLVLFLGAFVGWSVFAPLATTLRLSGALVSETPSFNVQHPYGGQIADVFVRQHSPVAQGDLLLRLDTALDQKNLESFLEMRRQITEENEVIRRLLSDDEVRRSTRAGHLVLRFDQARMQSAMKRDTSRNLARQTDALRTVIAHQTGQLEQMQTRAGRIKSLIDNTLMTQTTGELLEEQIQLVSSEIASQQARLIALEDQQEQADRQADLVLLSVRQELSATLETNLKRLEELAPQIANLEDIVRRSELRAPIDGVVTELHYEASGMYAGRGQTLLSLAQPIDSPFVTFNVPTHLIDQLRVGMTGRLTLPALSQRDMPIVPVTLTSISPRAETDENARPIFFEGRAEITEVGIGALDRTVAAGFAISADMPVELMIEGRLTTFAQYLMDPLVAAFQKGLQD